MLTLEERQRAFRFREQPRWHNPNHQVRFINPVERQFLRQSRMTFERMQSRMIRQTLSGQVAHDPLIEGLRHGGAAEAMRHKMTSFGSGWRGIISLHPALVSDLAGIQGVAGASLDPSYLRDFEKKLTHNLPRFKAEFRPEVERSIQQLRQASAWGERTGFDPMFVSKGSSRELLRDTIRHERIHSVHSHSKNHPFFRREIEQTPELSVSINRHFAQEPAKADAAIREYAKGSKFDQLSERLAWGNQSDRGFFTRAKAAGVRMPAPLPDLALTKNVMKTGEHLHQTSTWRRLGSALKSSLRMSRGL